MKNINNRTTNYPIDDLFLKRYSPRAMSGEKISNEDLMTLFDAARWAPSSYNIQPWRFIYAENGTPEFDTFMSFLVDFNKEWCKNASVLIVTISQRISDDGKEGVTHSFDTGAAWENLALQATQMNLVAHGMSGLDFAKAKADLGVPDNFNVEMMIAIGKHGKIEDLPENMRGGEIQSDRKKLEEIIFIGKFVS